MLYLHFHGDEERERRERDMIGGREEVPQQRGEGERREQELRERERKWRGWSF